MQVLPQILRKIIDAVERLPTPRGSPLATIEPARAIDIAQAMRVTERIRAEETGDPLPTDDLLARVHARCDREFPGLCIRFDTDWMHRPECNAENCEPFKRELAESTRKPSRSVQRRIAAQKGEPVPDGWCSKCEQPVFHGVDHRCPADAPLAGSPRGCSDET